MRFWFRKKKSPSPPEVQLPEPEPPLAKPPEPAPMYSDLEDRLLQQEILLEQARSSKKDSSAMLAKMDYLANSRERQLTFLLRKAQQEHRRMGKFLQEADALLEKIARDARD